MSPDLSSLESDLRHLRPAALDESLLARLEACTRDAWTEPEPAEVRFDRHLQQIAPAPLPFTLMAALDATLRDVPFPGAGNIVAFPQAPASTPQHHRSWWRTAAAVAFIGAVSALFMPARHHPAKIAAHPPASHSAHSAISPAAGNHLVPAGFNRSLAETRDEGVIWQANQQPHRVLKVVYMDRVTLKDSTGRTYQVEQPRVEYILVPATAD